MALRREFTKKATNNFVIIVTIYEKTVIFEKKVIKITFTLQNRLICCCFASFNSQITDK
jgi:hypothetical protein